jgi:hypothetical protein
MLLLDDQVLEIEREFTASGIPHAFGGAIALAYYATPRATVDIDVNVFLGLERAADVLAALGRLGAAPLDAEQRARLERDGQVRVSWRDTMVDVFFAYDPLHESCMARRGRAPLGDDDEIYILSAEDLFVFKVLFDRDKDWKDIRELIFCMGGQLDVPYVRDWLRRILPEDDARYVRFEETLRA